MSDACFQCLELWTTMTCVVPVVASVPLALRDSSNTRHFLPQLPMEMRLPYQPGPPPPPLKAYCTCLCPDWLSVIARLDAFFNLNMFIAAP